MDMSVFDADFGHMTPEYRFGLAQLREWHERCRAKRLGIKRKDKEVYARRVKSRRMRSFAGGVR